MTCSPFKLKTVFVLATWAGRTCSGALGLESNSSSELPSSSFTASQSWPVNSSNHYVAEKRSTSDIPGTITSPLTTAASSIVKPLTLSSSTDPFSTQVESVYPLIHSSIETPNLKGKTDDDKRDNERGVENERTAIKVKASERNSKSPSSSPNARSSDSASSIERLCSVNCKLCTTVGFTSASENSTKRHSFLHSFEINAIKAVSSRASPVVSGDEEWEFSEPDLREVQKNSSGYSTSEMARLGNSILSVGQIRCCDF